MEILIAVSIVVILAGLAFNGHTGRPVSATRSLAKNDVVQIANAVLAYESEYGKLPPGGTDGTVDGQLVRVLTSEDIVNNPKRIMFMEVHPAQGKRSGISKDGVFVDPWGNPYRIALAVGDGKEIEVGGGEGPEKIMLHRRVGVWNVKDAKGKCRIPVASWE